MTWVAPRSTCSHCGSLEALDQRVDRFPSTALDAGYPDCTDDAVAGCPWDSRVPDPPDPLVGVAVVSFELGDTPAELLPLPLSSVAQASPTEPLPAVAARPVGAGGTVAEAAGVTETSFESGEMPTALLAATL